MSARVLRGGVVAGAVLLVLAACVPPPPAVDPLPADPLEPADAPPAALEVAQLVGDVLADAESVWAEHLGAAPGAEVVLLQPGESWTDGCPGEESDPIIHSGDDPVALTCADGGRILVVPLEPLVALEDFAAAFVAVQAHAHHVAELLGEPREELLADCLAGVWAASADERGRLDEGDADEALALLDDSRADAFLQGFEGMPGMGRGDVGECVHSFGS